MPARLPQPFARSATGLRDFCCEVVQATADLVCAFKPQAAHFAAEGAEDQLAEVIAYIHQRWPHVVVILDAKRGDIGSTSALYAKEAFVRYDADAVTVHPYLGEEGVLPFLQDPQRGVALLCRTSNADSAWLQGYPSERPLYLRVAEAARRWNRNRNLMLVAGATYPEELARIRKAVDDMPLLVPGVGVQGGDLAQALQAGLDQEGQGVLINASRSVLYPHSAQDGSIQGFAAAARQAALRLKGDLDACRRLVRSERTQSRQPRAC